MNDIKDILRDRHGLGPTRDGIAVAVGVSSGTVSHVLERASAARLTWPLPSDIPSALGNDGQSGKSTRLSCDLIRENCGQIMCETTEPL